MDEQHPGSEFEEPLNAETPEDVAVLYAWANLHGAKYRDYSASRREYRAQVRHRAAEELRQAELKAQAEAEQAAAEAERSAEQAERVAQESEGYTAESARQQALRAADSAARVAAAERVEAARRAEAAAMAEMTARREEREIAEAHASAQRQAARYADSEIRRRSLAGPQPAPSLVPGLASDPYVQLEGAGPESYLYSPDTQLETVQSQRFRGDATGGAGLASAERGAYRAAESESRRRPQGYRPDEASGLRAAYRPGIAPVRSRINTLPETTRSGSPGRESIDPFAPSSSSGVRASGAERSSDPVSPAWLFESNPSRSIAPAEFASTAPSQAMLQESRERVASRWYAMNEGGEGDSPRENTSTGSERPSPLETQADSQSVPSGAAVLAVFSLAGGVGKTSLVATLGRAFSAQGQKVLLVDTTSHGLLPFYFGASELKTGVVRTFSPPSGSTDAAIHLVSYDMDGIASGRDSRDALTAELRRVGASTGRVLLDLNAGSSWLIRTMARGPLTVLVPVAPDMNSVISLQGVERFFDQITDGDGRAVKPYYVINQFDATLPLHLDVREVLRRQLGDRLLPYAIRRSPAVSEALAEGMTVVDYAPGSPAAEDYRNVAGWAESVTSSAMQGTRGYPWSER